MARQNDRQSTHFSEEENGQVFTCRETAQARSPLLRLIIEECLKWQTPLTVNFDFQNTFHNTNRETLWNKAAKYGMPNKIIQITKDLKAQSVHIHERWQLWKICFQQSCHASMHQTFNLFSEAACSVHGQYNEEMHTWQQRHQVIRGNTSSSPGFGLRRWLRLTLPFLCWTTIRRMRYTTQWQATFRVKSFKAAVWWTTSRSWQMHWQARLLAAQPDSLSASETKSMNHWM